MIRSWNFSAFMCISTEMGRKLSWLACCGVFGPHSRGLFQKQSPAELECQWSKFGGCAWVPPLQWTSALHILTVKIQKRYTDLPSACWGFSKLSFCVKYCKTGLLFILYLRKRMIWLVSIGFRFLNESKSLKQKRISRRKRITPQQNIFKQRHF